MVISRHATGEETLKGNGRVGAKAIYVGYEIEKPTSRKGQELYTWRSTGVVTTPPKKHK